MLYITFILYTLSLTNDSSLWYGSINLCSKFNEKCGYGILYKYDNNYKVQTPLTSYFPNLLNNTGVVTTHRRLDTMFVLKTSL